MFKRKFRNQAAGDVRPIPRWKRWTRRVFKAIGISLGVLVAATAIWALIYRDAAAYLLQSAKGQAQLLTGGVPISQMLENSATSKTLKRQLQLVTEVKNFAVSDLKLRPTQNYEYYLDLHRDYLVMVLTASPPLKMESRTWWFPIVGTVPYKGYFDKQMGLAEEKKLQDQGFETHFRPSPAYSTLCWFHDPLLSTMLQYGEYYLINTVIHESVHATLWIPGDVTFNENIASFIGNEGALQFYAKKYGKTSKEYKETIDQLADQKLFADFMNKVAEKLNELYESDLFEANKRERKPKLLAELKQKYVKEFLPKVHSKGYAGFEKKPWNNAMLMSYRHYNSEQNTIEKIYKRLGSNIPKLMEYLKQPDVQEKMKQEATHK
ncbi:MAG: aminopeptidase [Candidatus Sericytochromatia bacterium]